MRLLEGGDATCAGSFAAFDASSAPGSGSANSAVAGVICRACSPPGLVDEAGVGVGVGANARPGVGVGVGVNAGSGVGVGANARPGVGVGVGANADPGGTSTGGFVGARNRTIGSEFRIAGSDGIVSEGRPSSSGENAGGGVGAVCGGGGDVEGTPSGGVGASGSSPGGDGMAGGGGDSEGTVRWPDTWGAA